MCVGSALYPSLKREPSRASAATGKARTTPRLGFVGSSKHTALLALPAAVARTLASLLIGDERIECSLGKRADTAPRLVMRDPAVVAMDAPPAGGELVTAPELVGGVALAQTSGSAVAETARRAAAAGAVALLVSVPPAEDSSTEDALPWLGRDVHPIPVLGVRRAAHEMLAAVAARLASSFNTWKRHDAERQALMKVQLERIAAEASSKDTKEIVGRSLAN